MDSQDPLTYHHRVRKRYISTDNGGFVVEEEFQCPDYETLESQEASYILPEDNSQSQDSDIQSSSDELEPECPQPKRVRSMESYTEGSEVLDYWEVPPTKYGDEENPLAVLPDCGSPSQELVEGVQLYDNSNDSMPEASNSETSKVEETLANEADVSKYGRREKVQRIWSDSETRQLLNLYSHHLSDIGPRKRFKNKKDMWINISSRFRGKTAKQCEERFKTVERRRRKWAIRNNTPFSTTSKRQVYHLEASSLEPECQIKIKNIPTKPQISHLPPNKQMQWDHIPEPEVVRNHNPSQNTIKTEEKRTEENRQEVSLQEQNMNGKHETSIEATLLLIAARKEEGRERRHREKMEAIQRLQNMLQNVLEQRNNMHIY
ncbi:uncharacterized protein LOC106082925 isoform X2 [Stomoxys calcitrans]|uniref:uncharacterized protein LOC106082925 isoform X2 n=1 Tax=Stomoxys calcitrans TaxID=35570 RepID=UPI0027E36310|nr:uncharacterized protein LOC106082925 isoform X2 [Stomoxys calcitrans]